MGTLEPIISSKTGSLYKIDGRSSISRYISSSPETRAICNDPLILGIEYTDKLKAAMVTLFTQLKESKQLDLKEDRAILLHILRGGLNFGLREALGKAYEWNKHGSAYISSQRAKDDKGGWHITENRYEKVYMPKGSDLVLGDVVATGVSLEHAMMKVIDITKEQGGSIRTITFITIGGKRAEEILEKIDERCKKEFDDYEASHLVYIEGRFEVAVENDERLQIALGGTDLLRRDSLLTPEFMDSQSEGLPYALERCTIYDAGSRAFHIAEYLEDLREYWGQVKELAEQGTTLSGYLKERLPEDPRVQDEKWMNEHDEAEQLVEVAENQLKKINSD